MPEKARNKLAGGDGRVNTALICRSAGLSSARIESCFQLFFYRSLRS